mgnify:CR=1 FL=1
MKTLEDVVLYGDYNGVKKLAKEIEECLKHLQK